MTTDPSSDVVERMGEALFNLSDSLRESLGNDRLHERYEAVVAAWQQLSVGVEAQDATIERLSAELERKDAALKRLSSSLTGDWAGMYRERAEVIGAVEQIARTALSNTADTRA